VGARFDTTADVLEIGSLTMFDGDDIVPSLPYFG
jgi:hypothetical protein